MPLFRRRKRDDSPEHEQAVADLAQHGNVSLEEARRLAGDMSASEIAEFIELEKQAANEPDPPNRQE